MSATHIPQQPSHEERSLLRLAGVGSSLAFIVAMARSRADTTGHFVERTTVDAVTAALRLDGVDAAPVWFEATVIDAEPYIVGPFVASRPRRSALLRGEEGDALSAYVESLVAEAMELVAKGAARPHPWPGVVGENDRPATKRVEVVTVPARTLTKKVATKTRVRAATILESPRLDILVGAENTRIAMLAEAESACTDFCESTQLEIEFDERTDLDIIAAFVSAQVRRVAAFARRKARALLAFVGPHAREVAALARPHLDKVVTLFRPHADRVLARVRPHIDRLLAWVRPRRDRVVAFVEPRAERLRTQMGVVLRLLRREARANPRAAGLVAGIVLSGIIVLPVALLGPPEDASVSAKAVERSLVAVVPTEVVPAPAPPQAASALEPATPPTKVKATRAHGPRRDRAGLTARAAGRRAANQRASALRPAR